MMCLVVASLAFVIVDYEEDMSLRHVASDDAHCSEVVDQRLEAPHERAAKRCDGCRFRPDGPTTAIDENAHCMLCVKAAVGGGGAAASTVRAACCALRGLSSVLLMHRLPRTGTGEEGEAAQAQAAVGETARHGCERVDVSSKFDGDKFKLRWNQPCHRETISVSSSK